MIYEILIRFIIALSVIYVSFSLDLEYKIASSILATIYFFQYLIMLPFQNGKVYRYINFIIDIAFISLYTYLFQNPYFALFVLPFSIDFLRSKIDFNVYLFLSFIPLLIGFYISGFSDILHIFIYSSVFLGIFKMFKITEQSKSYIDSIKEKMENLYIKNLVYQDKLEQKSNLINLIKLSQKLKNKKITLKSWIFGLYDMLNADGILLFDLKKRKCINIGDAECNKDVLKYITDPFEIITDSPINEKLNAKVVVSLTSEINNNLNAVCLFLYDEELTDNEQIFEILKNYLDLYYCD